MSAFRKPHPAPNILASASLIPEFDFVLFLGIHYKSVQREIFSQIGLCNLKAYFVYVEARKGIYGEKIR